MAIFQKHLEAFGGTIEMIVPSRVDLAADFFISDGLALDFLRSHVVTNSRTFRHYIKDDKLQTSYIGNGSSPVQMRIYDKWAELLQSDKVFFFDVWRDKLNQDEMESVWRIEGQFGRVALKQFGISSVDTLFAKLNGLWAYLTEWASLRVNDDPNSARRTIHPLWVTVQAAADDLGDPSTLTRQIKSDSTAPVEWYVQHIAGCLIGLTLQRIWGFTHPKLVLELLNVAREPALKVTLKMAIKSLN